MSSGKVKTEIDLLQLIKALWHRIWAIILVAVLCAGIGFFSARFLITPEYQTGMMIYVNNSASSENASNTFTPGDLTAAQKLVDTYVVILKNKATLKEVIDRADLDYTSSELSRMISASSVNQTEIFQVNVTSTDPEEAALIANTIAEVLPEKISSIVKGSSVSVMDSADVPTHQVSPNIAKYTIWGLLLGLVLTCFVVVLHELCDTTIRGGDNLTQNYDLPVLAIIPDLFSNKESSSNYYSSQHQRSSKGGKK